MNYVIILLFIVLVALSIIRDIDNKDFLLKKTFIMNTDEFNRKIIDVVVENNFAFLIYYENERSPKGMKWKIMDYAKNKISYKDE